MRHPFWKWTKWVGWLSVGLSGCLHGQDWRAAVSPPRVRQVADRREIAPQPKVIGPRRTTKPNFVPPNSNSAPVNSSNRPPKADQGVLTNQHLGPLPDGRSSNRHSVSSPHVRPSSNSLPSVAHATPTAIAARPSAFTASGMVNPAQYPNEAIRAPTTHDEAQPRGAKVLAVEFVPPPAPPAAPPTIPLPVPVPVSRLTAAPSASASRLTATPTASASPDVNIETAHSDGVGVKQVNVPTSPVHGRATEPSAPEVFAEFERLIPRRKSDITRVPDESAAPDKFDEIVVVPDRQPTLPPPALPVIIPARTFMTTNPPVVPQSLPPVSPHESPDMTDANTTTESPNAEQEQIARPRDVAVLVEQVFEDLRQRRLDEARQRTQCLKQLVAKRLPVPHDISAEVPVSGRDEPQRLRVDPGAAPVKQMTNVQIPMSKSQ